MKYVFLPTCKYICMFVSMHNNIQSSSFPSQIRYVHERGGRFVTQIEVQWSFGWWLREFQVRNLSTLRGNIPNTTFIVYNNWIYLNTTGKRMDMTKNGGTWMKENNGWRNGSNRNEIWRRRRKILNKNAWKSRGKWKHLEKSEQKINYSP